jgi:hypothetical protein
MKKLIAESIFIFASILGSLWVDGYRENFNEETELNNSIITLANEIESNIEYSKEHLFQLENMLFMTEYMLDNFKTYTIKDLRAVHDNNPFVHRFSSENKVIYIKKYYSFIDRNFFLWSNAWEPDNIFFKSLLNSGELLKIKDKLLIKEIESIYTKQEERVSGFYNLRNTITQSTFAWYVEKSMNQQKTNSPFVNERDRELEVNLELRRGLITESIKSVQDYISSLNEVVKIISNNYKKV